MEWGQQGPGTRQCPLWFLMVGARVHGRDRHGHVWWGGGGTRIRPAGMEAAQAPGRGEGGREETKGLGLYASGCRLPAELRAKDTGAIQHLSAVIQGSHNELNALRCVNTELLFGHCVPGLSQSFCWAGLSPPASQGQGRLDPG